MAASPVHDVKPRRSGLDWIYWMTLVPVRFRPERTEVLLSGMMRDNVWCAWPGFKPWSKPSWAKVTAWPWLWPSPRSLKSQSRRFIGLRGHESNCEFTKKTIPNERKYVKASMHSLPWTQTCQNSSLATSSLCYAPPPHSNPPILVSYPARPGTIPWTLPFSTAVLWGPSRLLYVDVWISLDSHSPLS